MRFLAMTFLKEICFAEMNYWAYQREKDEALKALGTEDPDQELFLKLLTYYGRLAVAEDPRLQAVWNEWQQRFINTGDHLLREILEKVQDELFWVGPGRPDRLVQAQRVAIANDCIKWLPLCEKLNADFMRLRKDPEYSHSELYRKEARGILAEKYSMAMSDVKRIERLLQTTPTGKGKATPHEAMLELVAEKHGARGAKTVEKIHQDLLEMFPHLRKRPKKQPSPQFIRISLPLRYLPPGS